MGGYSFDVLVQHHPRRAELIAPLLAAVPVASVVADPDPDAYRSPWRTYRECLSRPMTATHRVVLQDDVTVCRNFLPALDLVIAARPDNPIVLFVGGHPLPMVERMQNACAADRTFADWPTDSWVAAVAVIWPVRTVAPVVEWVDAQRWPVEFSADDEILGRATRALGIPVVATVPSLVQHPDMVESVTGRRRAAYGENLDRVAWCFADDAGCDPLELDWR